MNHDKTSPPSIEKLLWIMKSLRDPETGCPWDLEQDYKTLIPHTIEETYELIEAIENEDFDNLKEELGDLLLHLLFYSQLATEDQKFTFDGVVETICEKMIRRHPHVFGEKKDIETADEVLKQWEEIKKTEKKQSQQSVLDSVPQSYPPLLRAQKILKKVEKQGFTWRDISFVRDKLNEELDELEAEKEKQDLTALEDEYGDVLYVMIRYGLELGLKPDEALRKANRKFEKRYRALESIMAEQNNIPPLTKMTPEEINSLWRQAKEKAA